MNNSNKIAPSPQKTFMVRCQSTTIGAIFFYFVLLKYNSFNIDSIISLQTIVGAGRQVSSIIQLSSLLGPFKCYVTQMGVGGGGVRFSGKKRYEGVMFNVINVTRGWVGVQFAENSVT